ncbi:DUF99 family protein [Halorubellus sp. JP-L1]|uniref:endonuclease dU n=1 Tax=Halorubellus sp. JP-L1 TaxID=2715753 RepID=UPI0014099D3C|nr:DUF99 family protein [Halorubellus sp. JP-L1]
MKAGARAVGVAESYRGSTSTLAAVVVRADRAVETVSFGTCTVGGRDATSGVADVVASLERPDARYVFVAGVAPAWYNLLDLQTLHERVDRPVLAVSFEDSDGLEPALREAFDGEALAERLRAYRALPDRRPVDVDDDVVFVRALGVGREHAAELVRGFTHEGGRPEPVRVAREIARAGDALRTDD